MAHTFENLLAHVIFSTKSREAWVMPDLKAELLPLRGPAVWSVRQPVSGRVCRPTNYRFFVRELAD